MIRLRFYLALASGALLGFATQTMARDSLFNPSLLEIDHPVDVDIHQFNRANMLPPGDYKVDIIINDKFFEKRDVKFV